MDARYNGYKGDIWVEPGRDVGNSIAVIATGEAVGFIEFGTGIKSGSPDYWFFSAKGRSPISLDGGGDHAHYTRYARDDNGERIEKDGSWAKDEYETESVEKPNSYITGPSYPHHCMIRTAEYLRGEIIPTAEEIGLIK